MWGGGVDVRVWGGGGGGEGVGGLGVKSLYFLFGVDLCCLPNC